MKSRLCFHVDISLQNRTIETRSYPSIGLETGWESDKLKYLYVMNSALLLYIKENIIQGEQHVDARKGQV